jgi:arabinogalactan oligomer/maltooligosaccharide transport system substrate-binding protein
MKKIVSLVVASMLALSVAACGEKTPTTPTAAPTTPEKGLKGTISVQAEEGWKSYYDAAIARFKADNPDAVVNLIVKPSFDHLDALDKTDVTNKDVADVFAIPADRIYGLSKNEALAPIDAKAIADKVGGFADYDKGLGGNFKIDGDYLAFPMNIETLIAFVNTKNAAAANVDTKAIEISDAKVGEVLIPAFNAWYGVALLNSADIELLGKDASGKLFSDMTKEWADLGADKQAVITEIFNYWKTYTEGGASVMWDKDAAWGHMDTEFTTGGKAIARIEGPWDTSKLSGLASAGADLKIAPIGTVTLNGKPLTHWKGGWGLAINARNDGNADQMALAEAFIAELMNPKYAVDFFKATGKIMENVPAATYSASDLSATDKLVIENVLASYADAPARPLFTEWGQVWDTWQNSLLSWSAVKPANAEAAYKEIKAAFDAMMLNF